MPLAGVPLHALETYAGRLVARGFKVAICEQVEQPGKGLVKRAVTRVLTPGTVVEPDLLPVARDNYLVAIAYGASRRKGQVGLAYCDASTGAFGCTAWPASLLPDHLHAELQRLNPAEVLLCESAAAAEPEHYDVAASAIEHVTYCPAHYFDLDSAYRRLCRHFGVVNLAAFGCEGLPLATAAAGAILAYLERMHPAVVHLLTTLTAHDTTRFVQMDPRTWSALEIIVPARESTSRATLLSTLDATRTHMGARLLRRTLLQPLMDISTLETRLDAITELHGDLASRQRLDHLLAPLPDVERLTARIVQGTAQPRDLFALAAALTHIHHVRIAFDRLPAGPLASTVEMLDTCNEFVRLIETALAAPDSPDAGRFRRAYNADLDRLIASIADSRQWIANLEAHEREQTGIKSLRVTFSKVFGYAIEVSRPNLARVPAEYERRQTLATGERYVTAALRDHEARVFQAEEQIESLDRQLFRDLLTRLGQFHARLRVTAAALAQLDVWLALAEIAAVRGYVRPQLTHGTEVEIRAGRHPVVEAANSSFTFVANDTTLCNASNTSDPAESGNTHGRIMLLTGPNMAGKSTYLRQVAQIVLLAQIGSFVPAQAARIGIVDRIFTRVGADDDLARGVSTFMREMSETAYILRHATPRSLIVFDEVGRGTSTQDGLAIAQAVIEYVHDAIGARTLFATHFHELATIAESLEHVRVAAMDAHEIDGQLVFLHRLAPGKAAGSYGVQVARLAGVPEAVTERASRLLLAAVSGTTSSAAHAHAENAPMPALAAANPTLADSASSAGYVSVTHPPLVHSGTDLLRGLARLNVAGMTPMEAINVLFSLQQRANALLQVHDA